MNIKDLRIRDPYIYKEDNLYYLYGTYSSAKDKIGFYGFKSSDLTNFDGPYPLFTPDMDVYGDSVYWAPELHYYKNKYYLFVTMKPTNHEHKEVFILEGTSPLAEFKPLTNHSITPKEWDCIDGTLFVYKNKPYLVFVHEWVQTTNGEMQIAELSDDLTSLISEPKLLFKAGDAKWVTGIKSVDSKVTDGPFLFTKDDKIMMIWSSFCGPNYALSLISSDDLYHWKQEDTPYIGNNAGHGMLFIDKGKVFLALHGPNSPNGSERLIIKLFDEDSSKYKI